MFHIQKLEGRYYPVATFFPTLFLPVTKNSDFPKLEAKIFDRNKFDRNKRESRKTSAEYKFNTLVIENFLNGKKPDGTDPAEKYFPSQEVLP